MPRLPDEFYDPDEDRGYDDPPWGDADFVDHEREKLLDRGAYDEQTDRWAEVDR